MNIKNGADKSIKHKNNILEVDNIDFYIIGKNLKTKWGILRPIKVKEYSDMIIKLSVLSMEFWEIKSIILKEIDNDENYTHIRNQLNEKTLIQCIQKNIYGLRDVYNGIFKEVFLDFDEKNMIYSITSDEEFLELKSKILQFNGIKPKKKSKNPEIEKYNKMREFLMKSKNGDVDFSAMYTSMIAFCGLKPHDINDFSLHQFFEVFKRLEMGKAFDTTTLFKTVDSKDKIKIINWYQSTLIEKESNGQIFNSLDDLKGAGNIFTK